MTIQIIGLIVLGGGVWGFQDGLCSILYYLRHDNEKWYYNHAVRVLRCIWGLVLIWLGIILVMG